MESRKLFEPRSTAAVIDPSGMCLCVVPGDIIVAPGDTVILYCGQYLYSICEVFGYLFFSRPRHGHCYGVLLSLNRLLLQ